MDSAVDFYSIGRGSIPRKGTILKRISYIGITLGFQPNEESSILSIRSIFGRVVF